MLFIRLGSALLSAYIFTTYMPNPAFVLWKVSPCEWSEFCYEWYRNVAFAIKTLTACLWMAIWICLEIKANNRYSKQTPRLLTHLRYGPIAVLVLSFAAIVFSDMVLIQYSRWQITRYIHSSAPLEEPSFRLHSNYRHWCGNGLIANIYDLYGPAAAAYFDDPDPEVRARSLRASVYVYDWINHPMDGPFVKVLRKARSDPDPIIRKMAAEYQSEFDTLSR